MIYLNQTGLTDEKIINMLFAPLSVVHILLDFYHRRPFDTQEIH